MNIKLGIAPIAWSNDDMPELGGDTPIETCLEEAKIAGFSGIELGGKFPRNPGITKFLLDKYQLKLPGGWYGAYLKERSIEEEWQQMQDHINLLKKVGFSACPKDAMDEVKKICDYTCKIVGGKGAFRELVELILKNK